MADLGEEMAMHLAEVTPVLEASYFQLQMASEDSGILSALSKRDHSVLELFCINTLAQYSAGALLTIGP
jgi:hypothetical protein